MTRSIALRLVFCVTAAIAASPASALANGTYVNQGSGHDSGNDCTVESSPCKNMSYALGQTGADDTLFVAGGYTYTASFVLTSGQSLVHKNFGNSSGEAILDNGSGASSFDIENVGAGGGRVQGFTIRSGGGAIYASAPIKIIGDRFDTSDQIPREVELDGNGGNSTVASSTFVDPTPLSGGVAQLQTGVYRTPGADGSTTIADNKFRDLNEAVQTFGSGKLMLEGNDVAGTHSVNGSGIGFALRESGEIQLKNNRLHDADPASQSNVTGVFIDGSTSTVRVTTSENEITGNGVGFESFGAHSKLSMQSDVIADNSAYGLEVDDVPANKPAKVENLTAWGNGLQDLVLSSSSISLDSSIIGSKGVEENNSSCKIKYSRGPKKGSGSGGCKRFQTTANPKFKHASKGNFHLEASSRVIDKGNPHKPPKDARDIDGDKRALEGDCHAKHPKKRRDIGADEYKCPTGHSHHHQNGSSAHTGHATGAHHHHHHGVAAIGRDRQR